VRPYIDDDLSAGRLVTPFAQSVPKDASWYLVYRAAREAEPAFVAFRAWIMRMAKRKK
jgi:LysR family glycine cleavage system transcriptional activator